jgi:hypothetical protein
MRRRAAAPVPGVGPRVGTNAFALASLVLGICGGAPLGLVFGLIALAQIRQTGERGRRLALAGIAASVAWLVVLTARAVAD